MRIITGEAIPATLPWAAATLIGALLCGAESFSIRLSNPLWASLGANSSATITITDNDTTTGNPIAGVPFFVRQQYIDFLGREPDMEGFAGRQNILSPAGDTSCDRIAVSAGFFRSPEFQDRGSFIFRFYSAVPGLSSKQRDRIARRARRDIDERERNNDPDTDAFAGAFAFSRSAK